VNKKAKKMVSFRLSETTIKALEDIAKREKLTQADVIAVLVYCFKEHGNTDSIDEYFDVARLG